MLREIYDDSTSAWKERTLGDAILIFSKSLEATESSEDVEVSPPVYNALTDIAAAILDSGVVQPYSTALQKDIAVEFAKRAMRAMEEAESTHEPDGRAKDMALLSYIAGTATTEQVRVYHHSGSTWTKRMRNFLARPCTCVHKESAAVASAGTSAYNYRAVDDFKIRQNDIGESPSNPVTFWSSSAIARLRVANAGGETIRQICHVICLVDAEPIIDGQLPVVNYNTTGDVLRLLETSS